MREKNFRCGNHAHSNQANLTCIKKLSQNEFVATLRDKIVFYACHV